MVCVFITSFPSLLAFFVINGRVNQHAIANVNAAALSDQRAKGKKGLHERARAYTEEKREKQRGRTKN